MRVRPKKKPAETEDTISSVLRIGVSTSLVLITAGTALSFLSRGGYGWDRADTGRLSGPGGAFPRSLSWLAQGVIHLDGQAVIVLGLALLIATPVIRVAVSTAAFHRQRDRAFVAITLAVLGLLALSLALGKSG